MRAYDVIYKTREGEQLSKDEIEFLIRGYLDNNIPDYQIAAWCMAVFFRGLSDREIFDLTQSMVDSGEVMDLSAIKGLKIDKHSTGGVGDKTTLVLGPIIAANGLKFAKLSGRGLGHTGGTVDKLSSIPGFDMALSPSRFIQQVSEIGIAVATQTQNIVPADKRLYGLRDVTATVESLPLIAASIMSKKLASGADALLLDVKVGAGALMGTLDEARRLAQLMVRIGKSAGKRTRAVITNMNQPLGFAVGNGLEVLEAIDTLKMDGPEDFQYLCEYLAASTLVMVGMHTEMQEAISAVRQTLKSGRALETFSSMLEAQGADIGILEHPEHLVQASIVENVISLQSGYVEDVNARDIGLAAMMLGAGRETKDDDIDPDVGIVLQKKVGDKISKGEPLAKVYGNHRNKVTAAISKVLLAFRISDCDVAPPDLILDMVE